MKLILWFRSRSLPPKKVCRPLGRVMWLCKQSSCKGQNKLLKCVLNPCKAQPCTRDLVCPEFSMFNSKPGKFMDFFLYRYLCKIHGVCVSFHLFEEIMLNFCTDFAGHSILVGKFSKEIIATNGPWKGACDKVAEFSCKSQYATMIIHKDHGTITKCANLQPPPPSH